ncbi:amino acid permease [Sphingomonas sp. URHD0057]|uniref:amino acid permease n=1 Tax=Sphingomonas sp. URHD0057 TaxID=1380389 RepID=UPI0006889768|nr:amino acid permease [Sphingomonas sp. URHD0057]
MNEPLVQQPTSPPRQLGFAIALALVVGNMIGSGIFLLPANLAPFGLNAIIGWIFTIGGSICIAAVFAMLARAMPQAAGPYDYVRTALGEPPAFFVMWAYWIAAWVTNAAISIAAVSYLSSLAPAAFAHTGVAALAAIGWVIVFTAVVLSGARTAGSVQVVTSMLKVLPLIAAVVIALVVFGGGGHAAPAAPTPVSFNGISGAAALTLWAMLGFECAAIPAQRVRDPERNIPRATIIGTLLVGVIYFTAFASIYLLLPSDITAKSSAPFADLASRYWGPVAGTLVVVFAAISCLGALNGWVLIAGDVPLALAERGVFPKWFAKLNGRGMPAQGLILSAVLSVVLIASNYTRGLTELYGFIILVATVATLVLYLAAAGAALRLTALGRLPRGFMTVVTVVGTVYALWTLYGAGLEATAWGLVLLATGIPVYLVMRSRAGSSRPAAASPAAPPGSSA